ncbi:MAG: hypothetical protein C0483_09950 [Pirellula sp.]|nr:hypothetical protein [Pirellula sp.]
MLSPNFAAAQNIHAIIVADTSPAAGWGIYQPNVEFDVVHMQGFFEQNAPADALVLTRHTLDTNEQASPARILALLGALKPAPRDTVVLYYSGHGGIDDRGSYFELVGGKLYRDEVCTQLKAKGARLAVLLSDCCNSRSDGRAQTAPRAIFRRPETFTPLFRSLFVQPDGFVDVTACAPGQSAFFSPPPTDGDSVPGSLFTKALAAWTEEHAEREATWDELVNDVGIEVHLAFGEAYPQGATFAKGAPVQTDQNVFAREYPGMPPERGPRIGIAVRDDEGAVKIVEVVPNSPACRAFNLETEAYVPLVVGGRVTMINGNPIADSQAFTTAIKESTPIIRLTIANPGADPQEFLVRLRY